MECLLCAQDRCESVARPQRTGGIGVERSISITGITGAMVEADVESEVHVKSCQRVLAADGSRNQGAPSYREENVRLRVRRAGFSKS